MKVYESKFIRNIALIGPTKSGKTTLAETMLFESGVIKRRGSVEEKSTVSDYHAVEQERGNSVYATFMHAEWRDTKVNILDTPGSDDFIGEQVASFRVADTLMMLVNAQNGVEVATEILLNNIEKYRKPMVLVVNQLDHPKSKYNQTIESLQKRFDTRAVVMQYPVNEGEPFDQIIDVLKMVLYKFPAGGGRPIKHPIPTSEKERAEELRSALIEKAAENDEALMEKYFETGTLEENDLYAGIRMGMLKGDFYPIFCVSARKNMGSGRLMGFIGNVCPSPADVPAEKSNEGADVRCQIDAPTSLFVYKTLIEDYLGKMNFVKVMTGSLKVGQEIVNAKTGDTEKINQLFIMDGKNRHAVDCVHAGDLAVLVKLKSATTNHTLGARENKHTFTPTIFPDAKIQLAIIAENKNDDEKLVECLKTIHEEDPTLCYQFSKELKQLIISGQGEMHLELVRWRLDHELKIKSTYIKPKIPYRETIQKETQATYRHKKQSGGAGQFGEVYIKLYPYREGMEDPKDVPIRNKEVFDLPWGGKLVFYNSIVGGVIDARFVPSVLKGIMEKMEEGPITGSYARDVCVALYDGKMHPVDSNDISFKIAGSMSFKAGFLAANPLLLEPIYEVEVMAPEELVGDVMADLQTRRSVIMGIDTKNNYQVIRSKTPLAELYRYSTSLKSITQGRAAFTIKFSEYAVVPRELQEKLAKEHADLDKDKEK